MRCSSAVLISPPNVQSNLVQNIKIRLQTQLTVESFLCCLHSHSPLSLRILQSKALDLQLDFNQKIYSILYFLYPSKTPRKRGAQRKGHSEGFSVPVQYTVKSETHFCNSQQPGTAPSLLQMGGERCTVASNLSSSPLPHSFQSTGPLKQWPRGSGQCAAVLQHGLLQSECPLNFHFLR